MSFVVFILRIAQHKYISLIYVSASENVKFQTFHETYSSHVYLGSYLYVTVSDYTWVTLKMTSPWFP